ncbi:unnamed protein product [Cuscuta campestris]|uniref:Uncharacterized protein n=1 Tax=Cuscuta campestris TaxID=132261 RepID=A0A484KS06_9ASTE|nr:unnamed protein product [Cuscuta campestris]
MGRGRVELKRIENKINRQVTFAKRRNGLLKKAYELSVLCDAEVALIVFSNRGKLYEFCSTSNSMLKTLERYQKCSYGTLEVNRPNRDNEQSSYKEYLKLKGKYESLQRYQRHLLGEDLGPLSIDEIEHLEHQLDTSLKHIRSTRTQMMLDQLSDLQTKEKLWLEANKTLESKLEEIYVENNIQQQWGDQSGSYDQHHHHHTDHHHHHDHVPHHPFFQPLDCDSTLHIGFNPVAAATSTQITTASNAQNVNAVLPGWML